MFQMIKIRKMIVAFAINNNWCLGASSQQSYLAALHELGQPTQ